MHLNEEFSHKHQNQHQNQYQNQHLMMIVKMYFASKEQASGSVIGGDVKYGHC